jgi:hypothetical protein
MGLVRISATSDEWPVTRKSKTQGRHQDNGRILKQAVESHELLFPSEYVDEKKVVIGIQDDREKTPSHGN